MYGSEYDRLERKVRFWERVATIGLIADGFGIVLLLVAMFHGSR